MPVNCVQFINNTVPIAGTYHSWSVSSSQLASNESYAYDGSYGDTSTYAYCASNGSTQGYITYACTSSVTGMATATIKVRRAYQPGGGFNYPGLVDIYYSWDGTNWWQLTAEDTNGKSDTTEQSYGLANFDTNTNLNTLQLTFSVYSGGTWVEEPFPEWIYYDSDTNIYDLAVTVT